MANINQKIESALSGLVNGNIWPLSKPLQEDPDTYIVYNPEAEYLDYGYNTDLEAEMSMQIHWFSKGHANYIAARRQLRDTLRAAGFLLAPSPFVAYEEDNGKAGNKTGWTHMVLTIRAEDD
jgi:hypothetical protein